MTIANYLTLMRILIIIPMVLLLWVDTTFARWGALGFYTLACVTDFFDGWLARRRKEITPLGTFLDPIADKLLIAALLVMLLGLNRIDGLHVMAAMIILMRELAVSGLREHLAGIKVDVPVSALAKWKTFAQMFSLGFLIMGDAVMMPEPFPSFYITIPSIGQTLLWTAAILTLYTGWHYLRVGLNKLKSS